MNRAVQQRKAGQFRSLYEVHLYEPASRRDVGQHQRSVLTALNGWQTSLLTSAGTRLRRDAPGRQLV